MTFTPALLRGIAGWRFAIWSRTDWLSPTILTFRGDSSVWKIGHAFLIALILA